MRYFEDTAEQAAAVDVPDGPQLSFPLDALKKIYNTNAY